ncbi:unnamed protein product [Periconia digitata]|uniref:Uncharacterized protein n=1 Tax=Periconia digitata TaxID=1303443 RepID=A0A9W4UN66_9PLEO|nr:unnamed protein product [Periconia digitata]
MTLSSPFGANDPLFAFRSSAGVSSMRPVIALLTWLNLVEKAPARAGSSFPTLASTI